MTQRLPAWPAFPSFLSCTCGARHIVAIHGEIEPREKVAYLYASAAHALWHYLDGWRCPACFASAAAEAEMRARAGQAKPWAAIEKAMQERADRLHVAVQR